MANSTGAYYKSFYDKIVSLGRKMISSDFTLEIEGYEDIYLLTKKCPWPVISATDAIEIPIILGGTMAEPQQNKFYQQSPIEFNETNRGTVEEMLDNITAQGGMFDAKIYHGVPSKNTKFKRILGCLLVMDTPDTSVEDRGQALLLSGTLHFHYFGEKTTGNSPTI